MTGPEIISSFVVTALGANGSLWLWLKARAEARAGQPAQLVDAQSHMQHALNQTADTFTKVVMDLVQHQQNELGELRKDVSRLDVAEQNCRKENTQLRQMINSLVRKLKGLGVDVEPTNGHDRPAEREAFAELKDGKVTLYQPDGQPLEFVIRDE